MCRIVEERGVVREAREIAKKVVEDDREKLEDDGASRARVYMAVGIVEALTAAKGMGFFFS